MSEESFNHTQLFQQAIATTITCRTIIKYNSNLNAEQKAEILTEIEQTLGFLEKRLAINATLESSTALSPEKLIDLLEEDLDTDDEISGDDVLADGHEELHISLQNLHRLYQAYLSNKPGKGIAVLETRYKTVMDVLDQLQEFATQRHDATSGDITVEGLIHRVRGFVTAVYCMFREFAALFTKIVEGKTIDMDTEALALFQKYPPPPVQKQLLCDVTPLVAVYGRHLQLQEHKGALIHCTRDATAFLIFLEANLGQSFERRHEIIAPIKTTVSLLNELTSLLTDYEQAMSSIIQSQSASQ
jgi:CRISPR/Cas system CSM-associated protein Csm2 small subunit